MKALARHMLHYGTSCGCHTLHDLQVIGDLVDGNGSIIQINDKKLASTLRLKLNFTDTQMLDVNNTS